ncbi:MAG: helix-turn-helix transcriptional regulator [Prevotella sp.]|nr:helix-turn-helix transcriptional regulator [Prevotella sp.]
MRLRNNIFAAAFDYLKREKGIKTQKKLAELMGVSEDTITRILKDRCEVTEDIITKLQTASGCIFNLQWLRGEDPFHMLAIDAAEDIAKQNQSQQIDQSSLINAALAAKDETIAAKDEVIKSLQDQIADLRHLLAQKMTKDELSNYPFVVGVADEHKKIT